MYSRPKRINNVRPLVLIYPNSFTCTGMTEASCVTPTFKFGEVGVHLFSIIIILGRLALQMPLCRCAGPSDP